jgi:hypothetical protein
LFSFRSAGHRLGVDLEISGNVPGRCSALRIALQNEFANGEFIGYLANMADSRQTRLKRIMKDALRIQDRFAAEPVLARTGKGYLKSDGVATLQRIKAGLRKAVAH